MWWYHLRSSDVIMFHLVVSSESESRCHQCIDAAHADRFNGFYFNFRVHNRKSSDNSLLVQLSCARINIWTKCDMHIFEQKHEALTQINQHENRNELMFGRHFFTAPWIGITQKSNVERTSKCMIELNEWVQSELFKFIFSVSQTPVSCIAMDRRCFNEIH